MEDLLRRELGTSILKRVRGGFGSCFETDSGTIFVKQSNEADVSVHFYSFISVAFSNLDAFWAIYENNDWLIDTFHLSTGNNNVWRRGRKPKSTSWSKHGLSS